MPCPAMPCHALGLVKYHVRQVHAGNSAVVLTLSTLRPYIPQTRAETPKDSGRSLDVRYGAAILVVGLASWSLGVSGA